MKILLVDDERRLAAALARGLSADGFDVTIAHDGTNGLAMAMGGSWDMVILDIMLPGLNGFQVCAKLRETGCDTPILMLTAKDGEYDEAEGLDTGADDYLRKPFSYMVLLARIRALTRRAHASGSGPTSEHLAVGDLTILLREHRCFRGSSEITLTAREFEILTILAQRAGRVVAKSEIIDAVWDINYDGDLNVVEVHISALRRKIDAPFGSHSIQTIRGVGYRLEAGQSQ